MGKIARFFVLWVIFSVLAFTQSITLTSPDGGESWPLVGERNITWKYSGIPDNTLVKLVLFKNDIKLCNIVQNVPIRTGSFNWWRVGVCEGGSSVAIGGGYKVRIRDMDGRYPHDESNGTFIIRERDDHKPDLEPRDIFCEDGMLKVLLYSNELQIQNDFVIYHNGGGAYPPAYVLFRRLLEFTGPAEKVLELGHFNWPEGVCSLNFEVTVDPNHSYPEKNESNNTLRKRVYRERNAFHVLGFPFKLGRGQSQISVKKDEQVNFYSRENFSSSELHRDDNQFEIQFPVTVWIQNCGGKPTTQRLDLFVYGSVPSMNTDWPGENRTGIVLQPGEAQRYTLTVVVKMPWIPGKPMVGHFQVVLIENDGGHERKVISAHTVFVDGQLAQ